MYKLIEYHDAIRIKFKKDDNNNYFQYYDNINNCIIEPKVLDIKNIKDKDLVSIVKTLTKTHNPFIFDYNFIIKNEIYRLNYLIDNHIDNYNECSLTGNVRPSHLRSLINVLEEIDKKLSTVSGIKTELYHSEDQNLH